MVLNPVKVVQTRGMRLDHVSYVTSHDQLADTVQRLGSRLGGTFVDGGFHPRFGTRNFTMAISNGQYIEVVCPLEHPSSDQTPWGKVVSRKSEIGGGWLTWVFSTNDISPIVEKFGRESIEGQRTRPDGSTLKWNQIGVKEIYSSPQFPFFIEWLTENHPSFDGNSNVAIEKITVADKDELSKSWFKDEIMIALQKTKIEWASPSSNDDQAGIVSIRFSTPNGDVEID